MSDGTWGMRQIGSCEHPENEDFIYVSEGELQFHCKENEVHLAMKFHRCVA